MVAHVRIILMLLSLLLPELVHWAKYTLELSQNCH